MPTVPLGSFVALTTMRTLSVVVGFFSRVIFDTRTDPVFPRNAVFASAGWERLDPTGVTAVKNVSFAVTPGEILGYLGADVIRVDPPEWQQALAVLDQSQPYMQPEGAPA